MSARCPGEWHKHANSNMSSAYSTQVKAIKQIDSSRRTCQEALEESLATHNDLNSSLESKVQSSHRIIEKLDKRGKSLDTSIDGMKHSHGHLLQALCATEQPLTLCKWRLEQREKRPLREHVRDHVELALEEERSVLVETQRKMNDAIKMSLSMIALLEGKRDELKHDLSEKSQALTVDELCLRTTHRSTWHAEISAIAGPGSSLPSRCATPRSSGGRSDGSVPSPLSARQSRGRPCTRIEESNKNEVLRQEDARRLNHSARSREEAAQELMGDNRKLTERCEKLTMAAAAKTEKALQDRINVIQQMRRRLELEARELKKKEEHTKATISETRSQIQSLAEPIAQCSTHCSIRKQRAGREQIVDPVETRLEVQMQQLTKTADTLRRNRELEHGVLTELQEHMERLREDLSDKTAALNIDLNCLNRANMTGSPFSDRSTRSNHSKLESALKKAGALNLTRPRSSSTSYSRW